MRRHPRFARTRLDSPRGLAYPVVMQWLTRSFLLSLGLGLATAAAADWPQFLGPTRNAVYAGNDLAATWPADGPMSAWQIGRAHV